MNTPRLFYCPLEGYRERYTFQWAAPVTGWLERNWLAAGVDYVRVDPSAKTGEKDNPPPVPQTIKTGSVVDGVGRSVFSFNQIQMLLRMAERGVITSNDVIYFDDFWTPGIEALPYAFHLLGVKPKMYAFLHAQSVDVYDFTYPMKKWIRGFEKSYADVLDGIFVCCPTLKGLVHSFEGGICPQNEKVHVTGHPFSSKEVMSRMPEAYRKEMWAYQSGDFDRWNYTSSPPERKDQVVWSSRWDQEKNPRFFLNVVRAMPYVQFVVCTSAPSLRSNRQWLLDELSSALRTCPNLTLKENLTKEEYYAVLCESKIQFNSASQDFVAITLLEASVAGCYPVYPEFRSFPETFQHRPEFMYDHLNLYPAVDKIASLLKQDVLWTTEAIQSRSWIHTRFDSSWLRMLEVMKIPTAEKLSFPSGKDLWS